MDKPFVFSSRYPEPSQEVLRKLQLSQIEAKNVKTREMHCPICGFLVRIIPENQTDLVFVYCRKCKFDGVLSPAYFRRMKNYHRQFNDYRPKRIIR